MRASPARTILCKLSADLSDSWRRGVTLLGRANWLQPDEFWQLSCHGAVSRITPITAIDLAELRTVLHDYRASRRTPPTYTDRNAVSASRLFDSTTPLRPPSPPENSVVRLFARDSPLERRQGLPPRTSSSTSSTAEWIRPLVATSAGASSSRAPPERLVIRPPASSTMRLPAATSHGPRRSSQ